MIDYNLNKRPRQMARKPAPKQTAKQTDVSTWQVFIYGLAAFCLLITLVGAAAFVYGLVRQPDGDAPLGAINGQQVGQVTIGPTVIDTLTATSSPTASATPTATASEYVQEVNKNDNIVQYIEVTRLVIVTTTQQPTAKVTHTPRPTSHPTSTPNSNATQAAIDQRQTDALQWIGIYFLALVAVGAGVWLVAVFVRAAFAPITEKADQIRDRMAGVETTADEIVNRSELVSDVLKLFDISIKMYGVDGKRLAGWRDVPGWNADKWTEVTNAIRGSGVVLMTQRGVGTFLAGGSLRVRRLQFEIGELTPTPLPEYD